MKRQKIKITYKPFNSEHVNHTFLVMNNQGHITSETLENDTFVKASQERITIEVDLLEKMSEDARDIVRIMLVAPREFLFVLSRITGISRRQRSTVKTNLKSKFRVWLIRFLKAKYNYNSWQADIKAGKVIREIKELVY